MNSLKGYLKNVKEAPKRADAREDSPRHCSHGDGFHAASRITQLPPHIELLLVLVLRLIYPAGDFRNSPARVSSISKQM